MSNPISTLPTARPQSEPELEVDELVAEGGIPELEVDEDPSSAAADVTEAPEEESKGRTGIIAVVLAVLLVASFAINLKQSRDVAALETESAEFEQALTAAVERIDLETARANGAESALDRVDVAVDIVNEKVLGLQEALDGLRAATIR